jgi:hypothetical protein
MSFMYWQNHDELYVLAEPDRSYSILQILDWSDRLARVVGPVMSLLGFGQFWLSTNSLGKRRFD